MGRRLNTFVHVPDDEGGYAVFGPDDEVPAALAKKIGDHAWVDDDDEAPKKAPAKKAAAKKAPAKKSAPEAAPPADGGDDDADGDSADSDDE